MREEDGLVHLRRRHRGLAVIHSHCAVVLCLVLWLSARSADSNTFPNKRGVQSTSSSPGKIVIKRMSERMFFAGAGTIGPPQQLPTVVENTASQLSGHMSESMKLRVERELKSRAAHNHQYRRHRTDHHTRRRHNHRHAGTAAEQPTETLKEVTSRPQVAKNEMRGHHTRERPHSRKHPVVKDEVKDDADKDKGDQRDDEDEGVKFKGSVEWLNKEEEEGRWIPGSTVS